MSKTGDQLQAEAHAPTKVKADAARAKVRDTHASRSARERSDPKVAKVVDDACAGLDEAKQLKPKDKGGRRKGSKNRRPDVIARERILRVINKLGESWMEALASKEPYLFIQLVKRVIPNTAPVAAADPEGSTVRLRYITPPLPVDRQYGVEFDTPTGTPIPAGGAKLEMEFVPVTAEQYEQAAPGALAAASRSTTVDPSPVAPSAPEVEDESTDRSVSEPTPKPGYDAAKLTAETVFDAAMEGKPGPERHKLRTLIVEAGHKFNAQLHTKFIRQAEELKKLRKAENHENRMRMYAEDAGPEEGWSG